jgi:tetratricopeptide (TPR) repeat protein
VNDLLIGLLSAVMASNAPVTLSNLVLRSSGISVTIPDKNDPVEKELAQLMADDDVAQAEVDEWIRTAQSADGQSSEAAAAALQLRTQRRLESVRRAYEDFLRRHPAHARGHIAFGSFLQDIADEEGARVHWEKGRDLDPKNPAAWNNLANYYGHNGPVTNAFACYVKAIDLNPYEPTYYQNLATTVFLFRRDATNFFQIDEPEVFRKALQLYHKALELDPGNFLLATDLAQTYYGIILPKNLDAAAKRQAELKLIDEALAAWRVALQLAGDETTRQGIYVHFARLNINAARFEQARRDLNAVTNESFTTIKERLTRKLESTEAKSKETAAPTAPQSAQPM